MAVNAVKRRARHTWSESAQRDKSGPGTEVGTTHSGRGTLSKGGGVSPSHPGRWDLGRWEGQRKPEGDLLPLPLSLELSCSDPVLCIPRV